MLHKMQNEIKLRTNKRIRPVIYCFTTPNDRSHDGYVKIGYTEKETADTCIYNESRRTDTKCEKQWESPAILDDFTPFTDHDFHKYLELIGIERKYSEYEGKRKPEYFKISPDAAKELLNKFKEMKLPDDVRKEYELREEQQSAVNQTLRYLEKAEKKEALLNAKPRFGKTLTVYDYCKKKKSKNILIVTNRPVIATSWYDDYVKFLDTSEYIFVSNCDAVKNKPKCISRDEFIHNIRKYGSDAKCIEFVSLQDLKGSKCFGGKFDKLRHIADMEWDILIVDESHEGVETFKSNIAFNKIKRAETIYLSGSPFKQIENERFPKDAIFNWTYADEQEKKESWDYSADDVNPYEDLPQLNLFTYRLSDMFADEDRMNEENQRDRYFDLNEFFKATDKEQFVNDSEVDIFLDKITSVEKYPLANEETKNQIKHSLWLLDRVNSAKAMARKIKNHPAFQDYKIIVAAGDGKIDEDDIRSDSAFDRVKKDISAYNKTITLSVGQLTTGVTIPEWSAVFMLCNVKSPALYIQASFRVQNPCTMRDNDGEFIRKENAYVFDFDPSRTLEIMERFANDLCSDTANGKGNLEKRKENIEKLIKYFPITGEDDNGDLVSYLPSDVISIPRRIQAKEIVRHGFMCNFLFQNVGRLFNDERAKKIVSGITEQKTVHSAPDSSKLSYDENGNTKIDEQKVKEKTSENIEKIDSEITKKDREKAADKLHDSLNNPKTFLDTLNDMKHPLTKEEQQKSDDIVESFANERANKLIKEISNLRDDTGKNILTKKAEKEIVAHFNGKMKEAKTEHDIEMEQLRVDWEELRQCATSKDDLQFAVEGYHKEKENKEYGFACEMSVLENQLKNEAIEYVTEENETKKQEKINKNAEADYVYPKLRAFARSISSFLMAYGDENTTCDKFGEIIDPKIFKDMTGIELDDYMYLLEQQYFNESNFNDSIKEFFEIKASLANYFDSAQTGDIFDYIPPQKTNQIFTPKAVVKKMVDILEENNPGCFDDPDKTFIDIYMKSGLFVAEIVKCLFQSERMRELYPDDKERLRHIFEHQVYGLAPTEIIYRIASNFIFGSDLTKGIKTDHIIQLDALPYAEKGTLEQKLQEVFG